MYYDIDVAAYMYCKHVTTLLKMLCILPPSRLSNSVNDYSDPPCKILSIQRPLLQNFKQSIYYMIFFCTHR